MDRIEYAYHTTNVLVSEESTHPTWTSLLAHPADHSIYDGPLTGLDCVFFSTTLWKSEVPTKTQYPRQGNSGDRYWRIKVPMSAFNSYTKLWYCNTYENEKRQEQIHLVFTRNMEEKMAINGAGVHLLDMHDNEYLYRVNNSWFSTDWNDNKKWVNFAVLHDFPLCVWDDVVKQ